MNTPRPVVFAIRFITASLVGLSLLVLGPIQATAQSPWIITDSSPYNLGAKASQLENEYYRVEQWGFVFTRSTVWHDAFYLSPNVLLEAGVVTILADWGVSGDFNGDGKKDLVINWFTQPGTIERPPIAPSVLLNNGAGGLTLSPSAWVNGIGPARMAPGHPGVADFNHDGADDFVASAPGIFKQDPQTGTTHIDEPIALVLSSGDGRLFDATTYIAGQESGAAVPGPFGFFVGSGFTVGDFNGDGHKDFYQGDLLFLNDGHGHFTRRPDLLPPKDNPFAVIQAGASADLDNDGVDDLVIGYATAMMPVSGHIFLSNGTGGIAHGRKIPLPPGIFGLQNTINDFITLCDLNHDGLKDIVIAETHFNPGYRGRVLQVFMNKRNGQFVDESWRIVGEDRRDDLSDLNGFGQLHCLDVNGDGYVDLVDSGGGFSLRAARVFINNGRGVLQAMPRSILPIVRTYHLEGQEHLEGIPQFAEGFYKLIPIDVHGDGRASFFVAHTHAANHWPATTWRRRRSHLLHDPQHQALHAPVASRRRGAAEQPLGAGGNSFDRICRDHQHGHGQWRELRRGAADERTRRFCLSDDRPGNQRTERNREHRREYFGWQRHTDLCGELYAAGGLPADGGPTNPWLRQFGRCSDDLWPEHVVAFRFQHCGPGHCGVGSNNHQ